MTRPFLAAWHDLVGPLRAGESALVLAAAVVAAVATGRRTARRVGAARGFAVGAMALDLVGGLVAFQLPATRAHYRPTAPGSRLAFTAAHLQPFVLAVVGEGSWRRAAIRYVTAVSGAAALEHLAPRSAGRRRAALVLALGAAAVDLGTDRSAQRWFGPVYLVKLIGGHASIPR